MRSRPKEISTRVCRQQPTVRVSCRLWTRKKYISLIAYPHHTKSLIFLLCAPLMSESTRPSTTPRTWANIHDVEWVQITHKKCLVRFFFFSFQKRILCVRDPRTPKTVEKLSRNGKVQRGSIFALWPSGRQLRSRGKKIFLSVYDAFGITNKQTSEDRNSYIPEWPRSPVGPQPRTSFFLFTKVARITRDIRRQPPAPSGFTLLRFVIVHLLDFFYKGGSPL